MDLGIIGSLFNHLYWRDFLSIIAEFIPQMLFLNSLFGYLCFLIVFKWTAAPSLIIRWKEAYLRNGLDSKWGGLKGSVGNASVLLTCGSAFH